MIYRETESGIRILSSGIKAAILRLVKDGRESREGLFREAYGEAVGAAGDRRGQPPLFVLFVCGCDFGAVSISVEFLALTLQDTLPSTLNTRITSLEFQME